MGTGRRPKGTWGVPLPEGRGLEAEQAELTVAQRGWPLWKWVMSGSTRPPSHTVAGPAGLTLPFQMCWAGVAVGGTAAFRLPCLAGSPVSSLPHLSPLILRSGMLVSAPHPEEKIYSQIRKVSVFSW